MKTIIGAVLSQEEKVKQRASAYLNDIYVNKDIVSSLHVRMKLAQFGLIYKAHVLGLDVHGEQGTLQWRRRTVVPEVPDFLTRRAVFSLCGTPTRMQMASHGGKHYKAQGKNSHQRLGRWD